MRPSGPFHVVALTGGADQPSSRFRVRQHLAALEGHGLLVRESRSPIPRHAELLPPRLNRHRFLRRPAKAAFHAVKALARAPALYESWRNDLTWLQRDLVPGIPTFEPLLKSPLVFDVDDALWLSPPAGRTTSRWIAARADVIVAGNAYLADWFSAHARDVRIIPTAVDTERFRPRAAPRTGEELVLGWIGTTSNLKYLADIEEPLRRFMDRHPSRLHVVSNDPPAFARIGPDRVRFTRWSEEIEVRALQEMDLGLMPLRDDEWARGKCSFKMLQYMAVGIPVVVSPVGMNRDVLDLGDVGCPASSADDWYDALAELHGDRTLARNLGLRGREVVEAHFSQPKIAAELAGIFHELL